MTTAHERAGTLLRHLRHLAGAVVNDRTDAELLRLFVASRDENAFAALVHRHASLVWGVCLHVLHHEQDAEDAFQATFVVLARKAGSIQRRDSLGSWLHGVAYRTALNARTAARRRRAYETRAVAGPADQPVSNAALRELQALLDAEVQLLPEKYRAPFVLCCLEGNSKGEAARELGWKEGTVSSRLAQARVRLRGRLARRGVELPAALCAAALAAAGAAAPPRLLAPAIRAVLQAASRPETRGVISAQVDALSRGAMAILTARPKPAPALVLLLAVLAASAGLLARSGLAGKDREAAAATPGAEETQPRTDRHGDELPPAARARMGTVRLRQGKPVSTLAFSADGKVLGSTSWFGEPLHRWDVTTGKELSRRALLLPLGGVYTVVFAPGGAMVATAGGDETIRFWDAATGKERRRLATPGQMPLNLTFAPGGNLLAWAGIDHTVHLVDVSAARERRRFEGHHDPNAPLAFAPDGKLLATTGRDGRIWLWETATGKELHTLTGRSRAGQSYALVFAPDGRTLASGGYDESLRLWEVATGKEVARLGERDGRPAPRSSTLQLAFAPHGQVLAACQADGSIHLWDVGRRQPTHTLAGHPGGVCGLAFSPDGKTVASGGTDRAIRLWEVATGKELVKAQGPVGGGGEVSSTSHSPRMGRFSCPGGGDGRTRLWEAATGREVRCFPAAGWPGAVALSPDGKTLAGEAEPRNTIALHEAATGKRLRVLKEPEPGPGASPQNGTSAPHVLSLAFAPDGKLLASGGASEGQGTLRLWDVATGKLLREFGEAGHVVGALAFSPDGKTLASAGSHRDSSLRLWEVATGTEQRRFACPRGPASCLAWTPSGRGLAACGPWERPVRRWELLTGKELAPVGGWGQGVACVAFAPDGRTLAGGSADGTVRIWEAAAGTECRQLRGHGAAVTCIAFAANGSTLVSGSADTTSIVWDATGGGKAGPSPGSTSLKRGLEGLWNDLAAEDAVTAYRAVGALVAAPRRATLFLQGKLKPAAAGDARRVGQLIADLDSDRFAARVRATAELEKFGAPAEEALRRVLAGRPSLEVRHRAERLLERLQKAGPPLGWRQPLRALEALEQMGTPEARQVLAGLSRGAPEARLTREAKASLERLARRHRRTAR